MAKDIEVASSNYDTELQRIGKVAPKFACDQEVKCTYKGKEILGKVSACGGYYFRNDIMKHENKYLVVLPGINKLQWKWEHELEAV